MTRNGKVRVATIVILLGAVAFSVARRVREPRRDPEPEDTVYAMLNAARTGDIRAYLASHDEPMRATLRKSFADSSDAAFATYLRESNAAVKGTAISDLGAVGSETRLRVEYVYEDRNEVQIMYLAEGPNGWKITRTENDERIATTVRYGTPVRALEGAARDRRTR